MWARVVYFPPKAGRQWIANRLIRVHSYCFKKYQSGDRVRSREAVKQPQPFITRKYPDRKVGDTVSVCIVISDPCYAKDND
jgi:hypothetical protein